MGSRNGSQETHLKSTTVFQAVIPSARAKGTAMDSGRSDWNLNLFGLASFTS